MRTKHITITALTLALVGLPLLVAAGGHFQKGGPGGGFFGGHGPGIEGFLDHAAVMLDLSEDQEGQIEAIIDESRPAIEALREQAGEARRQFHETFDPGAFDEGAVTAFAQGQSELHSQMMVLGLQTFSQVWSVLTPEQREQLEEMRTKMQERRESHGPKDRCRR